MLMKRTIRLSDEHIVTPFIDLWNHPVNLDQKGLATAGPFSINIVVPPGDYRAISGGIITPVTGHRASSYPRVSNPGLQTLRLLTESIGVLFPGLLLSGIIAPSRGGIVRYPIPGVSPPATNTKTLDGVYRCFVSRFIAVRDHRTGPGASCAIPSRVSNPGLQTKRLH